jgi:hypothetical protein
VPEVEVLDHVEVVAERTVAIPELHRISGVVIVTSLPRTRSFPSRPGESPRWSSRASTFRHRCLPHQRDDLTALDLEVHVAERLDRAEALLTPFRTSTGGLPLAFIP